MSQSATLFRVMIASPGDVTHERKATCEAIYRWNSQHSLESNIVLLPLCWELDAPQGVADNAQELINEHLIPNSDMVVGIFKSKLGRRSANFLSYTIEEIKKHTDYGKQAILFFGKPARTSVSVTDAKAHLELLKFKEDIKQNIGKDALYKEYRSVNEFNNNIYVWLEKAIEAHLHSKLRCHSNPIFSFDDVVVERTTIQQKLKDAQKSIFISGASLISTVTTNFDECVNNNIKINLLMTMDNKSLIDRCAQLSYTTPSELEYHIHTTLNHFRNAKLPPQIDIRSLDAVMPFAMVGIDIDEPNGKIYVQQYLYETDPAKNPIYICYHGEKWYSTYYEQIKKMWGDGNAI